MNSNHITVAKMRILRMILIGFIMTLYASLFLISCKKDHNPLLATSVMNGDKGKVLKSVDVAVLPELYYGHAIFTRTTGKPDVVNVKIGSDKINQFEPDFVIYILNGDGNTNLVSSAIVKIDGIQIFETSDFSQNVTSLSKEITGLTVNSELEVEVRGAPGSYLDVWIEGIKRVVTDIDGNVYHIVTIGTQEWMVENLSVTHYRNGDPIPNVTGDTDWRNLTTGAYCNYNNDENNSTIYGRLYNWYAVTDSRNIAPTGWHVPNYQELDILRHSFGEEHVTGGALKETGTVHWQSPNTGATNESGFTALPGGRRIILVPNMQVVYEEIGRRGFWRSADYPSLGLVLAYNSSNSHESSIGGGSLASLSKYHGISVRCIKDY